MDFSLSTDQETFIARARQFGRERVSQQAADIDREATYPRELVTEAARLGLTAVTIPTRWQGGGRDYVSYALAVEAVAEASATMAVILAVTNSLVAEPIHEFGSEPQKDIWLPKLASGEALGAFALSEEQAGSDAANQQTLAAPDADGYVLTGRKVWVANAEQAEVAVVFAATDLAAQNRRITAFLVELDQPGVTRVACDSLGVRGLGCVDLTFDAVRIPASAVLGEVGQGFRIALRALEGGRVAIAAQSLGVGQTALDQAVDYARTHEAFGKPIGHFQAIQFQIADLVTNLEAARLLMWKAADQHDRVAALPLEAAMAKLQASEAAHAAADRAMQILASAGYRRGSTIERLFRDIRAAEIYQGTSEVQRLVIAKQLLGGEAR